MKTVAPLVFVGVPADMDALHTHPDNPPTAEVRWRIFEGRDHCTVTRCPGQWGYRRAVQAWHPQTLHKALSLANALHALEKAPYSFDDCPSPLSSRAEILIAADWYSDRGDEERSNVLRLLARRGSAVVRRGKKHPEKIKVDRAHSLAVSWSNGKLTCAVLARESVPNALQIAQDRV